MRDAYGFLVDEDLVEKYSLAIKKHSESFEAKKQKWKSFFSEFGTLELLSEVCAPNLNLLINEGIPFELKDQVWYEISGARKKSESGTQYSQLLENCNSSPYKNEIEKDITRTFSSHFLLKSKEGRDSLRRVLQCYSIRNQHDVGYCQSMNYLAGFLLRFVSEEHAFWILAVIVEDYLKFYYCKSMIGYLVDQKVFMDLLSSINPKLRTHFEDLGFPLSAATTRWFLCLFVLAFPTETVLRVWDCFFRYGSEFLLYVSLAIFKMNQNDFLSMTSILELNQFIHDLTRGFFDVDSLLKVAFSFEEVFNKNYINDLRARYWPKVEEEVAASQMKRDKSFLLNNTKFDEKEIDRLYMEYRLIWPSMANTGIKFQVFQQIINKIFNDQWRSDEPFQSYLKEFADKTLNTAESVVPSNPNQKKSFPKMMKRMFQYLDENKDGAVEFKELVHCVSTLFRGEFFDKLKFFLQIWDRYNRKKKKRLLKSEESGKLAGEKLSKVATFNKNSPLQVTSVNGAGHSGYLTATYLKTHNSNCKNSAVFDVPPFTTDHKTGSSSALLQGLSKEQLFEDRVPETAGTRAPKDPPAQVISGFFGCEEEGYKDQENACGNENHKGLIYTAVRRQLSQSTEPLLLSHSDGSLPSLLKHDVTPFCCDVSSNTIPTTPIPGTAIPTATPTTTPTNNTFSSSLLRANSSAPQNFPTKYASTPTRKENGRTSSENSWARSFQISGLQFFHLIVEITEFYYLSDHRKEILDVYEKELFSFFSQKTLMIDDVEEEARRHPLLVRCLSHPPFPPSPPSPASPASPLVDSAGSVSSAASPPSAPSALASFSSSSFSVSIANFLSPVTVSPSALFNIRFRSLIPFPSPTTSPTLSPLHSPYCSSDDVDLMSLTSESVVEHKRKPISLL